MGNNSSYLAERMLDMEPSATVLIADEAARMRRDGVDIIDFSAGRAAEPTPDYINKAAIDAIKRGDTHQTMAQGTPEFRMAAAQKLLRENGIVASPDESVMATLGCKEGLFLALMSTVNPNDEVIVEDPCFVSYKPTVRFVGGVPVTVPLRQENDFRWRYEELRDAVNEKTKAIILCSPHNPTGIVHTEDDLEVVAEIARSNDLLVITDETYERVTWEGHQHISIATRPEMEERTITIMSLTKSFAMGGWRIGFIHANKPIISAMVKIQQHLITCPGSFTQVGAAKALSEKLPLSVQKLWRDWEKRCYYVADEINKIPSISCHRPEGGFYIWIDITKTGIPSEKLTKSLLKNWNMSFVPGTAFGQMGEGYLRMTCAKSWQDLELGINLLNKALS